MERSFAGRAAPEIEVVSRGGGDEYNWTRPDGTYVLKDWAYWTKGFSRGWGCFQRKGDRKWNFVDADGRLLSGEWFDEVNSFGGAEGDPASAKVGGRWHALYGRRADGTPDLSGKSVDADDMQLFSCGLAAVRWNTLTGHRADCYGYVDASMNSVGPGESPFSVAYGFAREDYGGKWAWVLQESPSAGGHQNLMGLDGGLAFEGGAYYISTTETGPAGGDGRNVLPALPSARSKMYRFPASDDWSEIGRIGICDAGRRMPLDGAEGRLTLRMMWDRTTGRVSECIVARGSDGREHVACPLDGEGMRDGE